MICSFFAYYKPTFVLLFCKQVFTKNMIWVSLWSWRLHFEGMQKQHARRHMMSYLQAYKSFLWFTALTKQNDKYYSPCEKINLFLSRMWVLDLLNFEINDTFFRLDCAIFIKYGIKYKSTFDMFLSYFMYINFY